jgi:hypothetical protein
VRTISGADILSGADDLTGVDDFGWRSACSAAMIWL